MKEQVQLLIAQHKMHVEECKEELQKLDGDYINGAKLLEQIEMRTLFISELENLIS